MSGKVYGMFQRWEGSQLRVGSGNDLSTCVRSLAFVFLCGSGKRPQENSDLYFRKIILTEWMKKVKEQGRHILVWSTQMAVAARMERQDAGIVRAVPGSTGQVVLTDCTRWLLQRRKGTKGAGGDTWH
jgi:hypothetical protein